MRGILFDWHRRLGAALGLLLFVVVGSGTLAVFGHEWDAWLGPEVPEASGPVDWAAVGRGLEAAAPFARPGLIERPLGGPVQVHVSTVHGQGLRLDLHPTTGALLAVATGPGIQSFLRQFHKSLMVRDGIYVVTFSALVLLFAGLSGLIVYRTGWRYLLRLRWSPNPRVLWSDVHRTLGMWSLLFAVLIGLTGAWYGVQAVGRHVGGLSLSPPAPEGHFGVGPAASLERIVAGAHQVHPDLQVRRLTFRDQGVVWVDGQRGGWALRDQANRVFVDVASGRPAGAWSQEAQTGWQRWSNTADPLHFGTFGGLPVKIVWFGLGLALSLVVLAGPLLRVLRASHLRARSPAPPPRRARDWLAHGPNLVVGLLVAQASLQTVATSSLDFVAGRPLPDRVAAFELEGARFAVLEYDGPYGVALELATDGVVHLPAVELRIADEHHPLPTFRPTLFAAPVAELRVGDRTLRSPWRTVDAVRDGRLREALQTDRHPLDRHVKRFVLTFLAGLSAVVLAWVVLIGAPRRPRATSRF